MTTRPPMFPELRGQRFPKPIPLWGGGRALVSVSGREMRSQRWAYPRYSFDISYEALCADDSRPNVTARSLQMVIDLFHLCGGTVGTFLFKHRDDCRVAGQVLGTGDGLNTSFKFQRTLIKFTEPVGWVLSVEAVYIDGVGVSGWSLSEPNMLVFNSAPASGQVVAADFVFAFVCRFDMDEIEFDGFANKLYSCDSLKIKSVRLK